MFIREILDWLDKCLGPVERAAQRAALCAPPAPSFVGSRCRQSMALRRA
jgi:hypothetical protein